MFLTFFFNLRNILAQYFLSKCLSQALPIRKKDFSKLKVKINRYTCCRISFCWVTV